MPFDLSRMEEIYATHPLRAGTILARLGLSPGHSEQITEADLATDEMTRITDQNHPGGTALVRELAREAGIGPGWRVLDVGCGLGGPARILAQEFGAQVDGVELTATRYNDALQLTHLVSLDGQVRILHGDFLTLDLPSRHYDVVWGQAAWVHFSDLRAVFARCAELLRPGGQVVVEEAYLRRRPQTLDLGRRMAELQECWAAHLNDLHSWVVAVERQEFRLTYLTDLTPVLLQEYLDLQNAEAQGLGKSTNWGERHAWDLVCGLIQDGVIGYLRLVAQLKTGTVEPKSISQL